MSGAHHPNYRKIYLTLVILLVISVAGPFIGIAWVTLITAFGIAVVKATMVVQNFMHLKSERRIVKWVLAASLALMALFWAGVAPDVMRHRGHNWVNDAALAATARGIPGPHADAEGGGEEHADTGSGEAPAAASAAPAFDAPAAFGTMCVTCHGTGGAGNGPGAATLNPKPANFTDPAFWNGKTDAELVKAIREGGASVGRSAAMPAWGSLFSEAQAEALLAYLKTLRR